MRPWEVVLLMVAAGVHGLAIGYRIGLHKGYRHLLDALERMGQDQGETN